MSPTLDIRQNHFSLFALPIQFSVDQQTLSQRYRELQKEIHPDRFAGKGEREQRLAAQFAAYVNEAYQGLKSPLTRAEYLLKLADVAVDSQNETTNDVEFLMEQMELREALTGLRAHPNPESELDIMSLQVDQTLKALLEKFEHNYGAKNFEVCKACLSKLHFVSKLRQEIEQLEAQLFDD
mgnify:CR=1 FL=1